jgi:20S proteasome subunit beta 6
VLRCNAHARRTVLAVAGNDFCIVAASTRMSSGFDILTRNSNKMLQL